eukprot:TRINITY_DN3712_c4_g1_i1.p1 TRINITY_DN3712_c4_g1~~TRINITY_DN3712_c4_g1_i1.p1  ORF type:complete len:538 (-),score=137.99 TRINITY_DN3712_c4_g1_i1:196-1809(-)
MSKVKQSSSGSIATSVEQDIAKLVRNFLHKAPQIILHARGCGGTSATGITKPAPFAPSSAAAAAAAFPSSAGGQGKRRNSRSTATGVAGGGSAVDVLKPVTNAGFNFDMEEIPQAKSELKRITTSNPHASISLDILLTETIGSNDDEKRNSVLLERWTFHHEPHSKTSGSQKMIFIRLITLIRSLYSLARLLPCFEIMRLISSRDSEAASPSSGTFKLSYTLADSLDGAPIFDDSTESFVFHPQISSESKLHVSVLYQKNCDAIIEKLGKFKTPVKVIPVFYGLDKTAPEMKNNEPPLKAPNRHQKTPSSRRDSATEEAIFIPPVNLGGIEPALPAKKSIPIPIASKPEGEDGGQSYSRSERGGGGNTPSSMFSQTPDGNAPTVAALFGANPSSLGKTPPPFTRNISLGRNTPTGMTPPPVVKDAAPNPNFKIHKFTTSGYEDEETPGEAKTEPAAPIRRMSHSSLEVMFEDHFILPTSTLPSNMHSQDALLGAMIASARNAPALRSAVNKQATGSDLTASFDLLTQTIFQAYSAKQ